MNLSGFITLLQMLLRALYICVDYLSIASASKLNKKNCAVEPTGEGLMFSFSIMAIVCCVSYNLSLALNVGVVYSMEFCYHIQQMREYR
jgi:hypothetical protein